jgi:predicted SAM-dependent methyltransferase
LKVELGCGDSKAPGYIGVDKVKTNYVDIIHDLDSFPWPFINDQVTEIRAFHVIEHLEDVVRTIEEMHRICKPNALIHIRVPYVTSTWAFGDPTHKHYFNEYSFDYFEPGNKLHYYTTASLEIIKRDLICNPTPLGRFRNLIPFKKSILRYFLWNMIDEIYFQLRVIK